MLKSKYSVLAGAVLAASPLVGKAVTMTFTYDSGDISFSSSATAGSGTGTYNSLTNTITVTPGTIIDFGVDESVTGDTNTAPSTYTKVAQPANLGIAAFGMGFNTSNAAIASFDSGQDSGNIAVNSDFTASTQGGAFTGSNLTIGSIAGGVIVSGIKASTTAGTAQLSYGAGSPAELFNSLQIDAGTSGGTATITPTGIAANNLGYIQYNSGGTSTSSAPTYKSVTPTGSDVITQLPALTIIVAGGTTMATHQPIISLISGTTPAASYATTNDGTITMTGKGFGSYNVSTATPFTSATTGAVAVTGFNPASDTEVYALKLTSNGNPIAYTSTSAALIVADINGVGNSSGVVATTITGVYTSLFPGYSVLLTSTGTPATGTTDDLEFDFSQDTDAATPGLVLTGVAAVPEPATAAGVVLGAAGLLLGRRRNRITIA